MLYLNPPFFTIKGVVVGRDYSDPTQFWYFPNRPRLATDDQERPAIRFLVYRDIEDGDDATAGFLFFDTQLAWPDDVIAQVRRQLKDELDLPELPRLSPLLYRAGKVKLMFLDRKTVDPGEPPEGEEPVPSEDWVTALESAGMPSLYGENRAVFSAALTRKAAQLLLGSFDGFIPAGVIYELTYVAMQRAFQVTVEADWEIVYQYIQDYQKTRVFFYSSDVEKITEKLVEEKKIRITGSIEGVGDEGMQGEFNEVRKQLTQFVFEKFFEPKVNPKELLDKNVPDAILGFLGGLRDGGLPVAIGSTKRQLDVQQQRSLSIDYTVVKAVERVIAPQGHLSLFWEDFGTRITRDDVITVVSGDDDLWRQVSTQVLASAAFGPTDVDKIVVDLAYGEFENGQPAPHARRFSVVLDKDHQEGTVKDWYEPGAGTTMHYRFTVVFGPEAVVGDGVMLTSAWQRAEGPKVVINPATLYQERKVDFELARGLPKELFPDVLIHLRYADGGFTHQASENLNTDTPNWLAEFRTRSGAPKKVEYRLEYLRQGADPIDTDWAATETSSVLIRDPRPNLFDVRLLVTDPKSVVKAIIDFEYVDAENDVFESGSITFNKDNAGDDHVWTFHRIDPRRHRYRYRQVIVEDDGTVIDPGWLQSEDNTLRIGKIFAAEWKVRPEVVGRPLAELGLEKIEVELTYEDPANNYRESSKQTFVAPGTGSALVLKLKDLNLRQYRYTVRYVRTDGFDRRIGPTVGDDTFLVIPSQPPAG